MAHVWPTHTPDLDPALNSERGRKLPLGRLRRPAILLLLGESQSHAYQLARRLGALGFQVPNDGGLYRALHALETEGMVRSTWESSEEGPARRTYVLTAKGARELRSSLRGIDDERRAITEMLDRYGRTVVHRPFGAGG